MSVDSTSTSPDPSIEQRLGLLIDRLLDGAVVPFLGAGISLNARVPSARGCDEESKNARRAFAPTVWSLGGRLKQGMQPISGLMGTHLTKLLGDLKEAQLGQLSELFTLTHGPVTLCERLQIHLMAELEPLPAHYYLACLAREGLVRQLVTTNYDTCIETAHQRTFGRRLQRLRELPENQRPLAVISDLEEFRAHTGFLNTRDSERLPRLLVYKINGCAEHYRQSRIRPKSKCELEKAAESIILTERQLQDFRGRQWARDLLRVTARSRVLLFTGFGSEEPQVRHTMLLLVEEFMQGEGGRVYPAAKEVAKLPNAPFIHAFDPELTFTQYQPMHGFSEAHLKSKPTHLATLQEHNRFIAWRSASGVDAPLISHGSTQKLPADLFFARLYQQMWGRLLKRYLRESSPFCRWLLQLPDGHQHWRHWVEGLQAWLYPLDRQTPLRQHAFGAFPYLLELESRKDHEGVPRTHPALLWEWLYAMQLPRKGGDDDRVPYPCLREDSLQILCTLFLLYLLFGDFPSEAPGTVGEAQAWRVPWWRWVKYDRGGPGLRVVVPTPSGEAQDYALFNDALGDYVHPEEQQGLILYLVTDGAPPTGPMTDTGASLVYQVAIPSLGGASARARALVGDGLSESPPERNMRRCGLLRAVELRRLPLEVLLPLLTQSDLAPQPNPKQTTAQPSPAQYTRWCEKLRKRASAIRTAFARARAHEPLRHRLILNPPRPQPLQENP